MDRGLTFNQDACVTEFRVFALEAGNTNLCVYRPSGSESNTYNLIGRSPAVLAPGLNIVPTRKDNNSISIIINFFYLFIFLQVLMLTQGIQLVGKIALREL